MPTLILLALLVQNGRDSIEDLVRDLGHEQIEMRDRAHARLIAAGIKAAPALRHASTSTDAELRVRAKLILEVIERKDREALRDAEQMNALLQKRTESDFNLERAPGSAATKGARFELTATPFGNGWIVQTKATDYLYQGNVGPGRGWLRFDVPEIMDADGRLLEIERCGRCSPRKVFVKGAKRGLKARISGSQTWFSRNLVEFNDPQEGQARRVGDFLIVIGSANGLGLRVESDVDMSMEWCWSMDPWFDYKLMAGVKLGARSRSFS